MIKQPNFHNKNMQLFFLFKSNAIYTLCEPGASMTATILYIYV